MIATITEIMNVITLGADSSSGIVPPFLVVPTEFSLYRLDGKEWGAGIARYRILEGSSALHSDAQDTLASAAL